MNLILLVFCSSCLVVEAAENFKFMNMVNCTSLDERKITFEVCEAKDMTLNLSLNFHQEANDVKVRSKLSW
jgi:hypothetical protein